jgi:hypothetical protein
MSIDQFSHDVPKAIERISKEEKHETRRYSGIIILKEIALAAPSRYYHLITPVEQFFEQLFGVMTDSKVLSNENNLLFFITYFSFVAIYSRSIC